MWKGDNFGSNFSDAIYGRTLTTFKIPSLAGLVQRMKCAGKRRNQLTPKFLHSHPAPAKASGRSRASTPRPGSGLDRIPWEDLCPWWCIKGLATNFGNPPDFGCTYIEMTKKLALNLSELPFRVYLSCTVGVRIPNTWNLDSSEYWTFLFQEFKW